MAPATAKEEQTSSASPDTATLVASQPLICPLPVPYSFGPGRALVPTFSWSPDGEKIAFAGQAGIVIISLQSREVSELVPEAGATAFYPVWSPTGEQLAYLRTHRDGGNALYVISIDSGQEQLLSAGLTQATYPVWLSNGQRLGLNAREGSLESFYLVNPDGTGRERLAVLSGTLERTANVLSPDGQYIAFMAPSHKGTTPGQTYTIYGMKHDGREQVRWTEDEFCNLFPAWSPAGQHLAFLSNRNGSYNVFTIDTPGAEPQALTDSHRDIFQFAWSPDGQQIAYVSYRPGGLWTGDSELMVINIADGESQRLAASSSEEFHLPQWSPDGRQLAVLVLEPESGSFFVDVIMMDTNERLRLPTAAGGE